MRIATSKTRRSGATLVESAFVISIVVLFLFGIFEYGRFVMTKQILENAAREGARWAVAHTDTGSVAAIQDQVHQKLSLGSKQLVGYNKTTSITVFAADSSGNPISGKNWNDTAFGENIAVQISGTYQPSLPNLVFWKSSFTLTVKAVMASEAN